MELLEANPSYAHVRFPDGRESTVSLRHLAPSGDPDCSLETLQAPQGNEELEKTMGVNETEHQGTEFATATPPLAEPTSTKEGTGRPVRIRRIPSYLQEYHLNTLSGGKNEMK